MLNIEKSFKVITFLHFKVFILRCLLGVYQMRMFYNRPHTQVNKYNKQTADFSRDAHYSFTSNA